MLLPLLTCLYSLVGGLSQLGALVGRKNCCFRWSTSTCTVDDAGSGCQIACMASSKACLMHLLQYAKLNWESSKYQASPASIKQSVFDFSTCTVDDAGSGCQVGCRASSSWCVQRPLQYGNMKWRSCKRRAAQQHCMLMLCSLACTCCVWAFSAWCFGWSEGLLRSRCSAGQSDADPTAEHLDLNNPA
jgi:hypothetical protein